MVDIAICKSRKSRVYKNVSMEVDKLVDLLSKTIYTNESYNEYLNMDKDIQDNIKDVGGFVGGYLIDGKRSKNSVKYRSLITLDVDFGYCGMIDFLEMVLDFKAIIYTTHKHGKENERFRIVIPLSRNVDSLEYESIGRKICEGIGIDYFDDSTFESSRLMYFPSTSRDGEFRFIHIDEDILNVDEYLNKYENYKDKTSWKKSSRVKDIKYNELIKQQNSMDKVGIIGAFCRTYNIHQVIDKYLKDIYNPTEERGRYTYSKGSSYGGLVVYEDGNFAYSHHSTDPCLNKLCNSFDLVRNHLFNTLSENNSFNSMLELASNDEEVIKTLGLLSLEIAKREFLDFDVEYDNNKNNFQGNINVFGNNENINKNVTLDNKQWETDVLVNNNEFNKDVKDVINDKNKSVDVINNNSKEEKSDEDCLWVYKLEVNKKGLYTQTIDNIVIILSNDSSFKGKIAYNEFSHQIVIKDDLPWRKIRNKLHGETWCDKDDSNLRHYIEKVYKIKSQQAIYDALSVVASKHSYHPIKTYLNSLTWDGKNRIETLFVDYLGAVDNIYTRAITRKVLVGAVSRIFNPGVKFDNMVVFVGKQGIGKSHIISLLGKEWYSDSINTVTGKEAYEQLQEAWIVEMAELSATKKAEIESVKHFISKREDIYRVAYGRHVEKFKRQCVFFGTTNEEEFLKDRTGNRRFWPVKVGINKRAKDLFNELNDYEIDNMWAEAIKLYKEGERLILSKEEQIVALKSQEHHQEVSPKEGMIREYLDRLLPSNWDKMDIYARRSFISGIDIPVNSICDVKRQRVCAMEIWVELFGGDPKMLSPYNAREINDVLRNIDEWKSYDKGSGKLRFGSMYGYQKAFVRNQNMSDYISIL